eukprot:Colp12_sorted_trinity150504_noHs@27660
MKLSFLLALLVAGAYGIGYNTRTFGHSIKNGQLAPHVELTTFAHNCSFPPCAITMIHIPSIYPTDDEDFKWEDGILRVYVDGERKPSIEITLLQMAGVGEMAAKSDDPPKDGSPFGFGLMGKTAKTGGVYSTARIPFTRSIRTTITSPYIKPAVVWFIIRGLEDFRVRLGDLTLPASAKLQVITQTASVQQFDFVKLAEIPSEMSGALLMLQYDVKSKNFDFLEGCMRMYSDGAKSPLFLSSGAEDYFLSASYFDEGMFKTPNAGLTFFDPSGTISAYKTHTYDPILFRNGLRLIIRDYENTGGCGSPTMCPNRFCYPGTRQESDPGSNMPDFESDLKSDSRFRSHIEAEKRQQAVFDEAVRKRRGSPVFAERAYANYTTVLWVYTWPSAAAMETVDVQSPPKSGPVPPLTKCLSLLQRLEEGGYISQEEASDLAIMAAKGHETCVSLCGAMEVAGEWAARQLRRLLPKEIVV